MGHMTLEEGSIVVEYVVTRKALKKKRPKNIERVIKPSITLDIIRLPDAMSGSEYLTQNEYVT